MPRHYIYDLHCPRCGKKSTGHSDSNKPPVFNCGDCLMDDIEIVELTITNVTILPVPSHEAIDWFHHFNDRSNP